MLHHIVRFVVPALAVVAAILFITGSFGTAHPSLVVNESSPAPGDLLSSAPTQVKLVFTVEIQGLVPEQSFFWVVNEQGLTVMALGQVDLSNPNRDTMIANLPALDPGVYLVKWVAVSKADQGFAEGDYSFAVK